MTTHHVNLIPLRVGRRQLIRRRVRQWLPAWGIALLVSVGFCGWQYLLLQRGQRALAELEKQEQPARQQVAAVGQIRQRLDQLQRRETLLKTLNSTGRPLQLMGIVGHGAALTEGGLRIDKFDLSTMRTRQPRTASDEPNAPPVYVEHMELKLQGTAFDDLTVAGFVAAIEETGVFDRVVLESSVAASAHENDRHFKLVCTYR